MSVRVAIIDSGIDAVRLGASLHAARDFSAATPVLTGDALGHGSLVARLVLAVVPSASMIDARIFDAQQRCDAARVAAAIDWAVAVGAQVINLSIGLRTPSAMLRMACQRATEAGVLMVASAAARGGPVFPAAYGDCISVSGDARCAEHELSWLATSGIDFGACPQIDVTQPRQGGGASFAAARVAGRVAANLVAGIPAGAMMDELRRGCRFVGPERRIFAP